jgi:hypothetical protein
VTAESQQQVPPLRRRWRSGSGRNDKIWYGRQVQEQSQRQRAGAPALHLLGVHVGAEDGVDAGLVARVLAEPAEEVGVEADGDDFFGHGHDDPGVFPEGFVGGVSVGVGENSAAYFGWGGAAEPLPEAEPLPVRAAALSFWAHRRQLYRIVCIYTM